MMISLKAIQASLIPNKQVFHCTKYGLSSSRKKKFEFIRCKPSDSDSSENSSPTEGDTQKQELLVRIAMLQTQKVRLTDFLDERSSYLTQFAEEANAEFDKIGEDALKGLNEAEARIMENIEIRMRAFEETAEQEKLEIEKNEKKLSDFEDEVEDGRKEGLFFQNMRQRKPADMEKVKEEIKKVKEVTVDIARTDTSRRNIYIALVGLIIVAIVDSLISSSSEWLKTTVLGLILVGLLSQLFYEQRKLIEAQMTTQDRKSEEEKQS